MPTVTINLPRTTFVSSAMPDNNNSFYPLLYTGTDPNFQNCISLLEVELPTLPVTTVDSAILQLSVIAKSGDAPSPVVVNKVTSPFSAATVTYNTLPTYTATTSQISVTTTDLFKAVEIDITSLVNEWLNGTSQNFGIALTNNDGATVVQFANNNIVYEPYFPKLTLTYSEAPSDNTGYNFAYAQLAHVIEQIINLYPTNVITVFTRGLTASSVTGTPYELFKSSSGTFGTLFILDDVGQKEAIPLNAIAAIYLGAGSVYNPSITYLTPSGLAPGFDTNLLSAYHEYLPVSTEIDIFMGSNIHASGMVYKNEYGIIVLSDTEGNTPIFIPVLNANVILPAFSTTSSSKTGTSKVSVEVKAQ
ncbi:MAG TPA: DNRLRE domain-containing protein [Clostridiaceae bacterium]|nr:DNRLRE domain-containing protein [Clostridiaceae bacterium]